MLRKQMFASRIEHHLINVPIGIKGTSITSVTRRTIYEEFIETNKTWREVKQLRTN